MTPGVTDERPPRPERLAEEVAEVIANVIESRRSDVYTREGSRERVLEYYSKIGEDP